MGMKFSAFMGRFYFLRKRKDIPKFLLDDPSVHSSSTKNRKRYSKADFPGREYISLNDDNELVITAMDDSVTCN